VPAIRTPAASTQADGAIATTAIPAVATTPASTATIRGPARLVRPALTVIAAQ
jgi:hypothetical protein